MKTFCKNLPKIELHAHLNGSLSETTLKELGCLEKSITEYQKLTKLIDKNDKTLEDCFELFKYAQNATSTKENVYLATKSVIEDFYADNVIYLELRTTPREEELMSKREYIEAVIKAIIDNDRNILVKLLLSIDRRQNVNEQEKAMELIIEMKQSYPDIIKGVDFSGNPNVGSFSEELFQKAKDNGLYTAIHCAEVKNDSEVMDILKFRPDRLGHATFLHPKFGGHKDSWNLYLDLKIPTECCLSSNVICGTSTSYKDHHIQEWIGKNLPFCINTDDKGVFCTTLSEEFFITQQTFNLSPLEVWQISMKTADYTFCSEKEKNLLKTKIAEWKEVNKNLFF